MDENTIIVNAAPYPNRKIKGIIAEREINQETLCEMAGVSRQTLSNVLKGKPTIQVDSLVKVLSTLGYRLTLERVNEPAGSLQI